MRWADLPERDVVAAAVAGDRDAFGELWVRNHRLVLHTTYRRCSDWSVAEDITSQAFMRALKSIGSYEDTGRPFANFLHTIARNVTHDHFKSAAVRQTVWSATPGPATFTDSAMTFVDIADMDRQASPEEAALCSDVVTAVRAAIDDLSSPEQAEVMRMRYLDDMSIAEVAAALGVEEGAVKARAWRGCRQLAKTLREYA
jgi:RNA polymerase sigma-70 factor (ECF subfamily)